MGKSGQERLQLLAALQGHDDLGQQKLGQTPLEGPRRRAADQAVRVNQDEVGAALLGDARHLDRADTDIEQVMDGRNSADEVGGEGREVAQGAVVRAGVGPPCPDRRRRADLTLP